VKKVLIYSLVLMAVVILLNLEIVDEKRAVSPFADPGGAVDVLVFSTGYDLPPYPYLRGQIGMENTLLVEDLVLKCPEHTSGLWVALFDNNFNLLSNERFDLANDPSDVVRLLRHFHYRPLDTTAVLHVQGNLFPEDEAGRASYSKRFNELALHSGYYDPGLPYYREFLGGAGWLSPEKGSQVDLTFAWTNAPRAEFNMWLNEAVDGLVFVGGYGIADNQGVRHLDLLVNGHPAQQQVLISQSGLMTFPVSGQWLKVGLNTFELNTERTVSPFQGNGTQDFRSLGVLVDFVKFQAHADSLLPPIDDPHPGNRARISGQLSPGLAKDSQYLKPEQWNGREKTGSGVTFSWTRQKTADCRLVVGDSGTGTLIVTGYGLDDGRGERFLTLKNAGMSLGTLILPTRKTEMRFAVPPAFAALDTFELTLELDRITSAPKSEQRMLGALIYNIRFERDTRPLFDSNENQNAVWLNENRTVALESGALSGSQLRLGWKPIPGFGMPPIKIQVSDRPAGTVLFNELVDTSETLETSVSLPDNLTETGDLFLGIEGSNNIEGVLLTRLVLEYTSSDKLMALFENLGAKSQPWLDKNASWTLVSTNRPEGWVALTESISYESGVMSAVSIQADRTIYDNYDGEFRQVETP